MKQSWRQLVRGEKFGFWPISRKRTNLERYPTAKKETRFCKEHVPFEQSKAWLLSDVVSRSAPSISIGEHSRMTILPNMTVSMTVNSVQIKSNLLHSKVFVEYIEISPSDSLLKTTNLIGSVIFINCFGDKFLSGYQVKHKKGTILSRPKSSKLHTKDRVPL